MRRKLCGRGLEVGEMEHLNVDGAGNCLGERQDSIVTDHLLFGAFELGKYPLRLVERNLTER